MPTQLQLEGPELEPLLARVRAEHGSSARIVQAEKVRTGGLGGFFATSRFEITVEVDDPLPPVTSLLDLADQVSAGERAAAVSTESTGFAAVLARLGATAGEPDPPSRPVVPQQRQPSTPQTRPAAPHVAPPAPPVPPAPPAAPVVRRRRTDAPATTARPAPRTPAALTVPSRTGGKVAVRPVVSTAVRTVPAPAAARPAPGAELVVRPPSAPPATTAPRRARVARSAGALATAGRQVCAHSEVDRQLADLGLPAHLRPADTEQLQRALVARLRALPPAPRTPARAGGVLAVVGSREAAADLARQLGRELELPPAAVVTAPLRSAADARSKRSAWRRRRHMTVVVLDTPLTAAGALRTRALLDALEPTATWGLVEATRKTQDVGAWTRAVGRIDALALTCLDETADPAAVLELGIPVVRLDARKATPSAWAALICDRVAA